MVGNNLCMVYAISIVIIVVFSIILLISKPKLREMYYGKIKSPEAYSTDCIGFVKSFALPKKNCGKLQKTFFVSQINSAIRKINEKKNRKLFSQILDYLPRIKSLSKKNFDNLQDLPSINGVPRIVLLAEYCLKSTDFKYDGERIAKTLNIQNDYKTLCFCEIMALNSAFLFAILKKCAFVLQDLSVLAKMRRIAVKNKDYPNLLKNEKCYVQLKNSKLFLSFCSDSFGFESEECVLARDKFLNDKSEMLRKLFDTCDKISNTDFSIFYSPLQIFSKYDTFCNATQWEKINFLGMLKRLSDRENIDEFLFSIRLDNYMTSANVGHIKVYRAGLVGARYVTLATRASISTLALALHSQTMMNLIFGNNTDKSSKSILKNNGFYNTFNKISKFKNVNLGIMITNDKLRINPHLPNCIESADLMIAHGGCEHSIHITRGNDRELYLGNTKLSGTSIIKLSNKPLNITVVIPKND